MARPGTSVTLLDTPGSVSVESDTGTWFIPVISDRGPLTATLIRSLAHFVSIFGDRVSYSSSYDVVDLFFREGGNRLYCARLVGPGATSGAHNLLDTNSGISLVVTAIGPGAWSANYKVQVVAGTGSNFIIRVLDLSNNILEDSGDLADQQSAVNWSLNSNYVRVTLGATALNPIVAAAAVLTTGNDDRASIGDTQYQNALNLFTQDLGPGQVSIPGRTTSTAYSQLLTHASANNRVALLDLTDSPTSATLKSAISALTSRFGACFAPWVQIPGVTTGTFRVVPPSALVAGKVAKNDPSLGPDTAAAGKNGISTYAVGLSQPPWDDATRTDLNTAGVNVIRLTNGSVKVYGWRSLADAINDQTWLDFGNARLYMAIAYDCEAVAEDFVWATIDGQNGQTIGEYHDRLAGAVLPYFTSGQLFGDTADEAFAVDTGPSVNTLATIAALELHATVYVKMSPFAEYVPIQIVKRQITDSIV